MTVSPPSEFDLPRAGGCPFAGYAALRAGHRVAHVPGTDRYIVSRHEDIVHVTRHPEIFSNKKLWLAGDDPELAAIAATQRWPMTQSLVDNDPPGHTAFREVAFRVLSPARVRGLAPRIAEIVDELIDAFHDAAEVEFVSAFCDPLPMRVICEQLGLPAAIAPEVKRWSDEYLALASRMISKERARECQQGVVDMNNYLSDTIERRRAQPADDVISDLAAASTLDGRRLDISELTSIVRNMLTAGDETTSFMLANTMWLLLEHPDELAAARADRTRIPAIVEESLRLESPTQWLWRKALLDTELGGVEIPAGSWVHLVWGSANRDESVFARSERFEPGRPNARRHLAFGHGIHFCLGAQLARLEGRIAFERLLQRLGEIRRVNPGEPVVRLDSPNYRAVRQLRMELSRAA